MIPWDVKCSILIQDKEMLSVAVENKRDDQGLYEPVSPTPLPDSPVEENKGVATAPATKSQEKSPQVF